MAIGHSGSAATIGRLLRGPGFSLLGTVKTTEGASHPDRPAQFAHLNATAAAFLDDEQSAPVTSCPSPPASGRPCCTAYR